MKNAKIIGAFSGTGKSVLGARYKNVLDLDLGSYKFIDDCDSSIPYEARKASKKFEINPDWPNNYIEAINNNKNQYNAILVSYCPEIAHLLDYYFSPSPTGWAVLEQRFRERGNNQRYIEITRKLFNQLTNFPQIIDTAQSKIDYTYNHFPGKFIHKQLGDNEFLEQALKKEKLI